MRSNLNVDEKYLKFVTGLSHGPRHGNRAKRLPERDLAETLNRAWTIMDRYLAFRRRGGQPLPLTEFDFSKGSPFSDSLIIALQLSMQSHRGDRSRRPDDQEELETLRVVSLKTTRGSKLYWRTSDKRWVNYLILAWWHRQSPDQTDPSPRPQETALQVPAAFLFRLKLLWKSSPKTGFPPTLLPCTRRMLPVHPCQPVCNR